MSEISAETNQEPSYLELILKFFHQKWWQVETTGLDCLPDSGPALIVGNTSGYIPWPALMLKYSLTKRKDSPVYTLVDNNIIEDEKLHAYLTELNFVPWSYDNAKQLFEKGQLVVVFPEDSIVNKEITWRNRIKRFDWTKFLPAVELHVPIYPLATLGIDEANMVLYNSSFFADFFKVKSFPATSLFPWLPFPFNFSTLPVPWKIKIMPALTYSFTTDRETVQEQAKKVALRAEGSIQAEINRLLRNRNRIF